MHGIQPLTGPLTGLDAVRGVLEGYARRGVFRSFSESSRGAKVTFRFRWLWNAAFTVSFDTRTGAVVFERVLSDVDAELLLGIRRFLAGCCSTERPAHRRVDPARLKMTALNRAGWLSLRFDVLDEDYAAGARTAVNVVNELVLDFLQTQHAGFLARQFPIGEE